MQVFNEAQADLDKLFDKLGHDRRKPIDEPPKNEHVIPGENRAERRKREREERRAAKKVTA